MHHQTEQAPLWLRALRLPGWRWAPGMAATCIAFDVVRIDAVDQAAGVAVCRCRQPAGLSDVPDVTVPLARLRPNLSDPATIDLLRALAGYSEAEALISMIERREVKNGA